MDARNHTWKLVELPRVVGCKWRSVYGLRFKRGFRLDWFCLEELFKATLRSKVVDG